MERLNNKTPDEITEWIKEFHGVYKLDSTFWTKSDTQFILGPEKGRVCRYCKKNQSQTTFKNDAHLIPKFLGNINTKSFYECDSCNNLFGKYENDLSSFIGLIGYYDTPDGYGKRKIRTYKLPNSDASIYLSKRGMEINDPNNEIFEELEEGQVKRSKVLKTPYIPLYVYKALVKIFISVLTDEVVQHFDTTRKFLVTNEYDSNDQITVFGRLFYHWLNDFYMDYPLIQMYRKKEGLDQQEIKSKIRIPDKTMIIYFKSFAYQIFVPFDPFDKWPVGKQEYLVRAFLFPPIITNQKKTEAKVFNNYVSYVRDLSGRKKVSDEKDELHFRTLVGPINLEYPQEVFEKVKKDLGIKHS